VASLLLMPLVLGLMYWHDIQPQMENLYMANDTLCGGVRDFVYGVDPSYILYASSTNPRNFSTKYMRSFPHSDAIRELIKGSHEGAPMYLQWKGEPVDNVYKVASWDMAESTDGLQDFRGTECSDVLDHEPGLLRMVNLMVPYLGDFAPFPLNFPSRFTGCRDVTMFVCTLAPFKVLCPVTCGCAHPTDGILLAAAKDGCPSACSSGSAWRAAVDELDCNDANKTELEGSNWSWWATEFHIKMSIVFEKDTMSMTRLCNGSCAHLFNEKGCAIVPFWHQLSKEYSGFVRDPCAGVWVDSTFWSRPLSPICPETCGCRNGSGALRDGVICPRACGGR